MAISFIEALSGSANNGASVTINFSAAQSGDLVLVVGGHQEAGSNAGVSTSGYTEAAENVTPNRFSINYKFITSDTSVTCIGDGQASDGTAYVALVFRGVSTSSPLDTSITSGTGTGEPNSPSITTVTDGAAVISAFLLNDGRALNSGPSGYNNATVAFASEVNNVTAGAAWVIKATAGAENPTSWDLSGLTSSDVRASTIALRPATAGTNQDGVFSAGSVRGTATFVGVYEAVAPFSITGTATASFKGSAQKESPLSATGTVTATWTGESVSTSPVPFAMTGTGTASFVGALEGAGNLSATGTVTASFRGEWPVDVQLSATWNTATLFVGARDKLAHVRETIEGGAVSVSIH